MDTTEETIIGPNSCPRCGGEYGDHDRECYKERIKELEEKNQLLVKDYRNLLETYHLAQKRIKELIKAHNMNVRPENQIKE